MLRPYNDRVLVNNWFEDRALEEAVIKDYLEKKSKGELLTQKFGSGSQSSRVSLTTVNDGSIHIGDVIQLKCDGTFQKDTPLIAKAQRKDCYVSVGGVGPAVGSSLSEINSSTALVIRSVDGSQHGSKIKIGQPFAITNLDGTLFLHSNTRSYDSNVAQVSRHQAVDFVSVYNHECDWVATCVNPKFRLEAEGSALAANQSIVLFHMKTNKPLGVVANMNNSSRFELVAHAFLTSHKAEDDCNHWKFVTNIPSVNVPERVCQ